MDSARLGRPIVDKRRLDRSQLDRIELGWPELDRPELDFRLVRIERLVQFQLEVMSRNIGP